MIICTGCGRKNDDEVRFCEHCGKKLQSSRRAVQPVESGSGKLTRFRHKGLPQDQWLSLRRLFEAWCYLIILVGVGALCFFQQVLWPLYPAIGAIGLLLWFRRI